MKKNPWKVKSSRTIYQKPWIKFTEDEVVRPDGKDGTHIAIKIVEGVTVLPVDNKGNVYLIEEFKYAISKWSLEAISGAIEPGEDKLQAAKRDLKEEIGAEAGEWIYIGMIDPFTSVLTSPGYMYIAKDLKFKKYNREGTETMKIVKMPLKEAIEAIGRDINHAASYVLLLKASDYLKKIKSSDVV